jgi:hypothetical protein
LGPFQTATNVSETLEFDPPFGSGFLFDRFEHDTQDNYFNVTQNVFNLRCVSGQGKSCISYHGVCLCKVVLVYKNGDYLNFVEYVGQSCYHGNQHQPQEVNH